jgi:hypothetical protein
VHALQKLAPAAVTSYPSPQDMHSVAPGADANVLGAQVLQLNAPSASWKVPTGQSRQLPALLAPRRGPYVPAGQF